MKIPALLCRDFLWCVRHVYYL